MAVAPVTAGILYAAVAVIFLAAGTLAC